MTSSKSLALVATMTAFLCLTGSVLAAGLVLPETVNVESEPLTLGKILGNGVSVDPDVRSIELGSLPEPGQSRILSRTFIKMKAVGQGVTLPSFKGDVKRIRITRPQRMIGQSELRKIVKKRLEERRALGDFGRITVQELPDNLTVGPGGYQIKLRNGNAYSSHRGNQMYRFSIVQNGEEVTKFKARVSITMDRRVAVSVEKLTRGEELDDSKIEWKERDIGSFSGIPITKDRNLDQYIMARTLRAGQILSEEHLERPVVIERRDRVTIRYERNGLTLTTKGEAQEEGAIGDRIKVENLSSEQEIVGTVKKSGLVIVTS